MKGIGLVFAGGGGKGAYQIGVWKYLHQNGLMPYIHAVSGTSVGALNAALFASGDFLRAEHLWLQISPEQILSPKKITAEDVADYLCKAALVAGMGGSSLGALSVTAAKAALGKLRGDGIFSRDGLIQLISQGVNFSAIQNSAIPCYATCFALGLDAGVRRFDLRRYSAEEGQALLLASSALPLIFDPVEFQGTLYSDGGIFFVGDNIPVQPVYEMGVEYILVVHLSRDEPVDRTRYPGAKILEIIPQTDLGGLVDGTLDFTAAGARRRIEQGWRDTERIFGPFIKQATLLHRGELLLRAYQKSEEMYQLQVAELQRQKKEIKSLSENDGFDV